MVLVLSACSQILTQRCRQCTLADWYLGLVCVQKLLVFIQKIIYTGQDWSERDQNYFQIQIKIKNVVHRPALASIKYLLGEN